MRKLSPGKAGKRKPVRRYTVRVYEEETARQLEELAAAEGYREISHFFVDGRLRAASGGLSPWELQALEVLAFQLRLQAEVAKLALKRLNKAKGGQVYEALSEQAAESKEALALVRAILGRGRATRKAS